MKDHVHHLGILISAADPAAATTAMFVKRLTAVRLHVRSWARFSLSSYLGQLHMCIIAKQVLAAACSFMLPSGGLTEDDILD